MHIVDFMHRSNRSKLPWETSQHTGHRTNIYTDTRLTSAQINGGCRGYPRHWTTASPSCYAFKCYQIQRLLLNPLPLWFLANSSTDGERIYNTTEIHETVQNDRSITGPEWNALTLLPSNRVLCVSLHCPSLHELISSHKMQFWTKYFPENSTDVSLTNLLLFDTPLTKPEHKLKPNNHTTKMPLMRI